MSALIELRDGRSHIGIAPALGGGIAFFNALKPDGTAPVLRGWDGSDRPFALACNVLVPFSNRISGGGFPFEGDFIKVPCNIEGQEFPVHGDGFQRAWDVEDSATTFARLSLREGAIGPFRYEALLDYRLEDGRLDCRLTIVNTGPRLPFGGGFHPWFHRLSGTRLAFDAGGIWLADERHLPSKHLSLRDAQEFDFTVPRPLPDDLINNAFTQWRGGAQVLQPKHGLKVQVNAPDMDVAIVFSRGRGADVFCFEPVNHIVDAANQPGQPGLVPLSTGQSMELAVSLGWDGCGS